MPLLRDVRDQLGSSYLLDHVDNPVAWRTWSRESLDEAARLDRPVFLSVGYAACHWCHVMAHESFEDPAVAAVLNEYFVPDQGRSRGAPRRRRALHGGHAVGEWPRRLADVGVLLCPTAGPSWRARTIPPVERHGQASFTDPVDRDARGLDQPARRRRAPGR